MSLSSGGGMFTSSSPEDRRIGTELLVSALRDRERRYPKLKQRAPRPALRGSVGGVDRGAARRLGGARRTGYDIFCGLPPLSWRAQKISNSTQRRARAPHTCVTVPPHRGAGARLWPHHEADALAAAKHRGPNASTPSTPSTTSARFPTSPRGAITHNADATTASHPLPDTGTRPPRRTRAGPRAPLKVVYVVLESQYQSSMSAAVKAIDENENSGVACECVGYLLEELRDEKNAEAFKKDVEEANVFIGSLIFVQELAEQGQEPSSRPSATAWTPSSSSRPCPRSCASTRSAGLPWRPWASRRASSVSS